MGDMNCNMASISDSYLLLLSDIMDVLINEPTRITDSTLIYLNWFDIHQLLWQGSMFWSLPRENKWPQSSFYLSKVDSGYASISWVMKKRGHNISWRYHWSLGKSMTCSLPINSSCLLFVSSRETACLWVPFKERYARENWFPRPRFFRRTFFLHKT